MNILPLLGAYALAAQRILPLMQQCYASWTSINGASRIIKDITKALKLENEAEKENEGNREEIGIDNFESIHLEGVCFGYKKDNGILDHLNLRINRGERIGIMGASGVGKSTLGAILLGLKKPSAGRVFVGGKNLDAKTVNAWFQNVAYVSQNVFIADVSISENIALGTKLDEIDHQKLEYCLKITQLNVFAEERDGSYHSSVGERGNTLSAGQKQRIAVARALYKGAEFIVFDEPTSSLDKITEMDFVEAMSALPKEITLVIISHREEIFSVCNKIYKLENKTLKAVRKI